MKSGVKSRRKFLKLVATGSAAVLAGGAVVATAAPAKPASKRTTPAKPTASATEIRKQKEYTAAALKAIRDYTLPSGAGEPGFAFAPLVTAASADARRKERP